MKTIESDPFGWYCYTAIEFVDDNVLLGHCAGDTREGIGLATTQITKLSLDWIYSDATPDPVVLSDSMGEIVLGCAAEEALIRFILDGSLPAADSKVYSKPIKIEKKTVLRMQAFEKDSPASAIVSQSIGLDIYEQALKIEKELMAGLNYAFYHGSFRNCNDMDNHAAKDKGVCQRIELLHPERAIDFGYQFSGFIKIPQDGLYTFYLSSNDGSALFLNNHQVINNDGLHSHREVVESISLRNGYHSFDLHYFQAGGDYSLNLFWSGPGFERATLDNSVFYHIKE